MSETCGVCGKTCATEEDQNAWLCIGFCWDCWVAYEDKCYEEHLAWIDEHKIHENEKFLWDFRICRVCEC